MSKKITVSWEVSGIGDVEIEACELDGLTLEEVREHALRGAEYEVLEQGAWSIRLSGVRDAFEALLAEAEGENGDE